LPIVFGAPTERLAISARGYRIAHERFWNTARDFLEVLTGRRLVATIRCNISRRKNSGSRSTAIESARLADPAFFLARDERQEFSANKEQPVDSTAVSQQDIEIGRHGSFDFAAVTILFEHKGVEESSRRITV
jgi:hypothetical protein